MQVSILEIWVFEANLTEPYCLRLLVTSDPVSPQLATVKMLYTAGNFAQPTKPKLPNLTFTEPTYPIKPTKTNKPY